MNHSKEGNKKEGKGGKEEKEWVCILYVSMSFLKAYEGIVNSYML